MAQLNMLPEIIVCVRTVTVDKELYVRARQEGHWSKVHGQPSR